MMLLLLVTKVSLEARCGAPQTISVQAGRAMCVQGLENVLLPRLYHNHLGDYDVKVMNLFYVNFIRSTI